METGNVELLLARLSSCKALIRRAEEHRDFTIRIEQVHCRNKCAPLLAEIEEITDLLKEYAATHLPEDKKTIKFETGWLSFKKQQPRYYFDEAEVSAQNPQLLEFVKRAAPELVKTTEYVDWAKLKGKLVIAGDDVCYADTGEVIEGMRAQIQPDKFTITTM